MPKAKEQKETEAQTETILYDSKAAQTVPLDLEKNGRTFRVSHILNPIPEKRYFEFQESEISTVQRLKRVSSAAVEPIFKLWDELCTGTVGYKASDQEDWKERTKREDALGAMSAILFTRILSNDEMAVVETDTDLYDDETPSKIAFRAMYSGALVVLAHNFREVSQAEADEFLSIMSNQPSEKQLASAVKKSEAEKLSILGKKVLVGVEGYAENSDVPAWHLAETTKEHFTREADRMGKFLTPSHLMPGA